MACRSALAASAPFQVRTAVPEMTRKDPFSGCGPFSLREHALNYDFGIDGTIGRLVHLS